MQVKERLFKEIYNKTFPKLYHIFLRSLKNEELTNDVLQDTYLKLWARLDDLDGRQDYMPFLFFYARNFARKEIALMLNCQDLSTTLLPSSFSVDMDNELDLKEFRIMVTRVVNTLPPKRQQVYRMFKEEGFSYKYIANALKISSKTVDNHLNEAYKAVKKSLLSNYKLRNTVTTIAATIIALLVDK